MCNMRSRLQSTNLWICVIVCSSKSNFGPSYDVNNGAAYTEYKLIYQTFLTSPHGVLKP